jgi:hypothetical protein
MDNRLRIYDEKTGESRVILSFSDLEKTLQLMNRISSQVRPYVADFYNNVIVPTYDKYEEPNTGIRDGKEVKESERGISTNQIVDYLKKHEMEVLDKKVISERYLKPLSNQGILNEIRSEIDKRSFIYAPVEGFETGISSLFNDDTDPRLAVLHSKCYPYMDRLQEEFFRLSTRSEREKGDIKSSRYKVKNFDGDEIDFAEMKNYLGNPEKCFKMGFREEEENRHSKFKNSCLGRLFGYLKRQKPNGDTKKSTKETENPDIVDDVTIEHKKAPGGDSRKFQNTFDQMGPKTVLLEPTQNHQTVSNFTTISPADIQELNQAVSRSLAQIKENVKALTIPNIPYFEKHGSFDLEWYRDDLPENKETGIAGLIYCAAFVDRLGNETTLHLKDFNSNHADFMFAILEEISKYDILVGHSINEKKSPYKPNGGIDGDIEMLRKNCEMLASDPKMREQFRRVISNIKGLDVKPIFTSEHTKGMLSAASGIRLRGDSLNAISKIYLGEGKLEDLMGPEVESLSPEIQRLYCLQDAILPLKLIQKENFNLLKIFYSLAEESDVDFYQACYTAKTSVYWRGLFKKWKFKPVATGLTKWQEQNIERHEDTGKIKSGVSYLGGLVIEPTSTGIYFDITVWDVSSMYPTMCIKHNISPETVMCNCCKDDPNARISDEMMLFINNGLIEMSKRRPKEGYTPRPFHYWICKKHRGILPQIMQSLFDKKSDYKGTDY